MVDIHSHILPGLDDGPQELETCVEMVRMAAQAGTTDIVATPHSNMEFPFQEQAIAEKIQELREASGNVLRIHRGCDFHLHYDNIQDSLQNPPKYCINQKNYLLVEFSDLLIPNTTDDVFQRMLEAGITPIITHPERNMLLHTRLDKIGEWVSAGVTVQVTAASFLERFGRTARRTCDELMKRRLVHFVASDAHDTKYRTPVLTEAYEYVKKHYGEYRAQRLFVDNPRVTLVGEPIGYEEEGPPPNAKKWYQFW